MILSLGCLNFWKQAIVQLYKIKPFFLKNKKRSKPEGLIILILLLALRNSSGSSFSQYD